MSFDAPQVMQRNSKPENINLIVDGLGLLDTDQYKTEHKDTATESALMEDIYIKYWFFFLLAK